MDETKKQWQKDGRLWDGTSIVLDNMRIWNPTDEQLIEAGYVEYVPPVHVRTLEQAKAEKIAEIEQYNDSDNVNEFSVVKDGVTVTDWLTPEKRSNYRNSIDAANLVGLDSLSLYVGGMPVTLPTQTAELMLAQIQLYADQCFIITEQHKAAVDALETIEAVDAYDYETGYPEKLRFEVPLANSEGVVAEEKE